MAELVNQRLHRLRRIDVRPNRDLLVEEVAIAVLTLTLLPDDFVSGRVGFGYERFPDALGGIAVEELGANRIEVGKVFTFGL